MRKALLLLALTGVVAGAAPLVPALVTRVVDGATIEVRLESLPVPAPVGLQAGGTVIVRYIGVGLPASSQEAEELRNLNAILVENRRVFLELEDQKTWEGGKLWAYVFLDASRRLFVNAILISTPLATFSPLPNAERYNHILAYLDKAPQDRPTLACPVVYPWNEAGKYVGTTACVEGPVAGVGTSRAGDVFINLGKPYPDPGRFTLYIPARFVGKFEAAFGSRFWTQLVGARVQALGEIRLYQGVPEIQLSDPENLVILR
ncbi:MAG: hypothetical protein ACK42E_01485 [Candidatus Bipolaricaulaceae bacterium]